MKRVFSVLMICALLMAGLAAFAGAEGTPALAITVDQTAVEKGDTVTATVKASDYTDKAWSAMTVKVTYDPTVLSFNKETDVLSNAALEDIQTVIADVKDGVGTILINWISSDGVPAAEYLVQLQFTALAETTNAVISAEFTADGQAELGSEDPIVNTDDNAFSSQVVSSDPIVVQPEEGSDESPKTITGGDNFAGGSAVIDVNATYIDDENAEVDNYKVVITWNSFNYTFTNGLYWDVESLTWKQNIEEDGTTKGTWSGNETQDIKIENYSNLPITVKADYEGVCDFTFGTADASGKGVEVAGADTGAEVGTKQEVNITATFVEEKVAIEAPGVIGTIKITIA